MSRGWCYGGVAVTLCFALASCSGADEAVGPTEEELQVLTQVMLVEATLQDYTGPLRDSLSTLYYNQVYDRFGIDAEWLDGMRDRFGRDVKNWEIATDSVEARLTRHSDSLAPLLEVRYPHL